jgi:hypothetical protein
VSRRHLFDKLTISCPNTAAVRGVPLGYDPVALEPMGAAALTAETRKKRIQPPSSIVGRLTMKARPVGAALVLGGLVVGSVLGRMTQRRRVNGSIPNDAAPDGRNILLTDEQAEVFVKHLNAAKPPTGAEQARRQRALYEQAARLNRPVVRGKTAR